MIEDEQRLPEDDSLYEEELAGEASSQDSNIPAAITDTGCERELNEDRYAVLESSSGVAWVVCDGMGGAAGGELAAQLALDGMRRDLENLPGRSVTAALRGAVLEANRIIVLRRQNQAFAKMGTTVVAALFHGAEVAIANVGDSRAYLIRQGSIKQVTKDHTYVQELVDKGQISAEEALSHEQAHILTRAIGSEPGLVVDVEKFYLWDLQQGEASDVLVLCSDGLYSHVSDAEISQIVSSQSSQRGCVELVELAKERGGYDNITVSIIPLDGRLMPRAPEGYVPVDKTLENLKAKGPIYSKANLFRDAALVVTLSMLSVLSVTIGMAFYLAS